MERFQRWHPGCPPHPAGGADHGTHSDLPNDGGRGALPRVAHPDEPPLVRRAPAARRGHPPHPHARAPRYLLGRCARRRHLQRREKSATAYDAAPAVALGGAAYATLPLDIFVVLVAALSASY